MKENLPPRGAGVALVAWLLLVVAVVSGLAAGQLASGRFAPGMAEAATLGRAGNLVDALAAAAPGGGLAWLALPVLGPLVAALVLLWMGSARASRSVVETSVEASAARPEAPPSPPASPAVALRLLATLQEEARLVDFVREDIASYSDEQVGSAVRGIHAALRKAIDERLHLEPILPGEDGDRVEVPEGFPPAQIRLTGNLSGPPPYRGVLRHGGWRARDVRLPQPTEGSDPAILAPAEVEVG